MSTTVSKYANRNGLVMVDARQPLQFTVTRADVRKSKEKDPTACAIACAIKRQTGADQAIVYRSTAYVQRGGVLERFVLPVSAQKEIVAFDRSKSFEPGEYHLRPPQRSMRLGSIRKRSKKRKGRHQPGDGSITRRVRHSTTNVRDQLFVEP